jgi:hypothetical protein
MSRSTFPNGFKDGVTINNVPITLTNPGEVFFVSNADVLLDKNQSVAGVDQAGGGTFQRPFRTLDFANGQCTASRGDLIIVMPGHSETLSTAIALAMDIAGVTVLGLGSGTLRPKFILDTATTATIAVSAANVSFKNIVFSANFADIAELFTPTAVNLTCEDCKFTQEATNMNFVEIADTSTTDNEADGLAFIRCEWIEPDVATTSLVNVDADLAGLKVHDCYIDLGVNGVLSAIAEIAAGKDLTNVDIRRNYVSRLVAASAVQLMTFVDTTTTNTGIMEDNRCRSLDILGELLLSAGTNISLYNNLSTSAVDLSGYVLPVIDA